MVYCAYTVEYYTILKKKTFPGNEHHNTLLIKMSSLHTHIYSTASFTVLKNYKYVLDTYPPNPEIHITCSTPVIHRKGNRIGGVGTKGNFIFTLFLHCLSLCASNEHDFLAMCIYGHVKI